MKKKKNSKTSTKQFDYKSKGFFWFQLKKNDSNEAFVDELLFILV